MDKMVEEAFIVAVQAHTGQYRRQSRNPYFVHPLRVAMRAAELSDGDRMVDELIAAALLHDAVEDTWVTLEFIRKKFGSDVERIVGELTKDKQGFREDCNSRYTANLKNASNAAKLIKLLDIEDSLDDPFSGKKWTRYLIESAEIVNGLDLSKKQGVRDIGTETSKNFRVIKARILSRIKKQV